MALDREDEEWYANQMELFNHPGWKAFIEQVTIMRTAHNNILTVKNGDDLFKRLGQVDILMWIEGWEEAVRQQFEQANDQSKNL